ncbi:hypothetical protein P2318_33420 [Myxococcaceae bacterium GXIMD 01537]
MVATYRVDGELRTVVGFQTGELNNDTHGYVEVLFRGAGPGAEFIESVHYYFDVAGIEFATPGFLIVVSQMAACLLSAAILLAMLGVSALGQMWRRFQEAR